MTNQGGPLTEPRRARGSRVGGDDLQLDKGGPIDSRAAREQSSLVLSPALP